MNELVWLLLPIAAASGWYSARRSLRKKKSDPCFDINSDYFKGLNYLLNEQPDKAIEVFIRMVEVDNDTVETHLALGSLFRKRGEVDRAIRIHQNLIARPSLSSEQRSHALLELGEDYMRAGLLDRAESLFHELLDMKTHLPQALGHLIDIYQQEQDWQQAVDMCRRLESHTGRQYGETIAQYYCEMGEKALADGDQQQFKQSIQHALKYDPKCVRASILQGQAEQKAGNYQQAIKHYKQVVDQDIDFLPEVIDALGTCFDRLGDEDAMAHFLDQIDDRYDGVTPLLYKADILLNKQSEKEAMDFMVERLRQRPSVRGLEWLVETSLESEGRPRENLHILKDLISGLLRDKPIYECYHCGFNGKSMHWQCPGCKNWNSVKPIKGIEAE